MKVVRLLIWCSAIAVLSAVVAGFYSNRSSESAAPKNADLLFCQIQQPMTDGRIIAKSMEALEVSWDVTNRSEETLVGLQAQLDCQCQMRTPFPEKLDPGQTAHVTIRLMAPAAGLADRRIPIFCRNKPQQVGFLPAPFRVDVSPPFWLIPPKMVRLNGIVERRSEHSVFWECIERIDQIPLIERVELSPFDSGCEVTMTSTDAPWGEDGTIVKRRYDVCFKIRPRSTSSVGGTLTFGSARDDVPSPINWQLTAKPCLSAFPGALELSWTQKMSAIVTIVSRAQSLGVIDATSDSHEILVRPLENQGDQHSVNRFAVTLNHFEAPVPRDRVEHHAIRFSVDECELVVPVHIHE